MQGIFGELFGLYFDNFKTAHLRFQWADFTCDGKFVVASVHNHATKSGNHVCVWSTESFRLLRVMERHEFPIIKVLGHPKIPHLAVTAGRDGRVCYWDVVRGSCVRELVLRHEASQQPIDALDACFDPSGDQLAVCDLWGQLTVMGPGNTKVFQSTPSSQFFDIDVAAFVR